MDSLVNFNISEKDESLKININELYENKKIKDINTKNNYNKILARVHSRIKSVSKGINQEFYCWYIMPEVLIGIPNYDYKDCTAYVIEKLRGNGFIVRYTHPNLLFISWDHWIPDYVRHEYKKKTGITIDEYGNKIQEDDTNINSANTNKLDTTDNGILMSKNIKTNKPEYNKISQYKPSGSIIYTDKMLKQLNLDG